MMTLNRLHLLLCAAGLTMCIGCGKESSLRSENIFIISQEDPQNEMEVLDIHYNGEKGSIYIKSNVDYTVSFQQDVHNHDKDWVTFGEKRHDAAKDCDVIDFKAKPMTGSLKRLSGVLNLSCPNTSYGRFLVVRQGYVARYGTDFNFLKFGNKDPLVPGNERAFEFWYDDQKEGNPFSTTVIEGQAHSHFYGRNGYVQLGNDQGYGADMTIPYVKDVRRDSAIVVSFNALVMPEDNDEVTLEILGGGVFDGTEDTKTTFKASQFNNESESIWDGSLKSWVISSLDLNPITPDTRIKITAGKLEKMEKNNRILIDNINVFSLPRTSYNKVLAGGEK